MVPPSSNRISRVPLYLLYVYYLHIYFTYRAITSFAKLSSLFCCIYVYLVLASPISLATTLGISVDLFSSSYLDVSVHSVRFISLFIQLIIPHKRWVSPFGYLWLYACCQLPITFRRLPRPSSPVFA